MSTVLKRIETRHFRLVEALAQTNNMTVAAKQLHLTQSALSHQLKALEEALGYELFYRHGKKFVITPHGRRVLESAKVVLSELASLQDELQAIEQDDKVVLRIATECITTFQWLPRAIPVFKQAYPNVEVELLPNAYNKVTDLLDSGDIDMAIKMAPAKKPFTNHSLFDDQLVVVLDKNHKLASQDIITAEDVARENILLCPNAKEKLFRGLSLHVDISKIKTTEFPLTEAITEWCYAGMGISVLADWSVATWDQDKIVIRPLDVSWAQRSWKVVTLSRPLAAYEQAFLDLLRQNCPESQNREPMVGI